MQIRSFLYIYEWIEGTVRLLRSNLTGPVNIGSTEMISTNDLARMIKLPTLRRKYDRLGRPAAFAARTMVCERLGGAALLPDNLAFVTLKTCPWHWE